MEDHEFMDQRQQFRACLLTSVPKAHPVHDDEFLPLNSPFLLLLFCLIKLEFSYLVIQSSSTSFADLPSSLHLFSTTHFLYLLLLYLIEPGLSHLVFQSSPVYPYIPFLSFRAIHISSPPPTTLLSCFVSHQTRLYRPQQCRQHEATTTPC
jgi:hypothetical protein